MTTEPTTLDQESETMSEELRQAQIRARQKLQRLVEEKDIKPMSWEQLQALGDLWPEEENIDDFLDFLEKERSNSSQRSLDD